MAPAEVSLNFRTLRADFSSSMLKDGKRLYEKKDSCAARMIACSSSSFIFEGSVAGLVRERHVCQIEIDRANSSISLSQCDCQSKVDCSHIACMLFYIEEHFHRLLLEFLEQKQGSSTSASIKEQESKAALLHHAKNHSEKKVRQEKEKMAIQEFVEAAAPLANFSLFTKKEEPHCLAELLIAVGPYQAGPKKMTEITFAVKVPEKMKPVAILQPKLFFQSLAFEDPIFLGSHLTLLSFNSFGSRCSGFLELLYRSMEYAERQDKAGKAAYINSELVEQLFIEAALMKCEGSGRVALFAETFEKQYTLHVEPASLEFSVSLLKEESHERLVMQAKVCLQDECVSVRAVRLLRQLGKVSTFGCLKDDHIYLFSKTLHPKAKEELASLDTMVVPEPLFGTFFSYSLPELKKIGSVTMNDEVQKLAQDIYRKEEPVLRLDMDSIEGALSIRPSFLYGKTMVAEAKVGNKAKNLFADSKSTCPLARDVAQELSLTQKLLWGFSYDEKDGVYLTTSERKISEFFIETLAPRVKNINMHIGPSLDPYVSVEPSKFKISMQLQEGSKVSCTLSVQGPLKNVSLAKVLEAGRLLRSAIEIDVESSSSIQRHRYVFFDATYHETLCQYIEELSFPSLKDSRWEIPLWVALGIDEKAYAQVGMDVVLSKELQELRHSLIKPASSTEEPMCLSSKCQIKGYQKEGICWLRQLRSFSLHGILADDMGLGKTVQTIAALSDLHVVQKVAHPSLIVCPTSLVDNWIEEIKKFQPDLLVVPLTGAPQERKKILEKAKVVHIFIASYGLVQKDVEMLSNLPFSYVILDEGQAIKNRETCTARAVKNINGQYRLILTGTPIENSLDDLWSLFDFLLPGFLGSYDKFCSQYVRGGEADKSRVIEKLKKKVQPFVLRRMKQDVLHDLPSITHTMLHCSLSQTQKKMYNKIAQQARSDLEALVEKEGFEKAKLHVLATLTRLKQICCHPQLLPDTPFGDVTDCSKYEMFLQLVDTIVASKKKAVIFSQYAKMLGIMKQTLDSQGIASVTLDGTTKNRLALVQKFNEDAQVPFFLVSLRAGGNGLNLVGADTVIHYDLWWNPAVENQATDRVWRMGQKEKVQAYKLITKHTIEEKILQLQDKKRDLITNVVDSDEDVLSKLTWDDVLELLGDDA